jgi:hypothetical protein
MFESERIKSKIQFWHFSNLCRVNVFLFFFMRIWNFSNFSEVYDIRDEIWTLGKKLELSNQNMCKNFLKNNAQIQSYLCNDSISTRSYDFLKKGRMTVFGKVRSLSGIEIFGPNVWSDYFHCDQCWRCHCVSTLTISLKTKT